MPEPDLALGIWHLFLPELDLALVLQHFFVVAKSSQRGRNFASLDTVAIALQRKSIDFCRGVKDISALDLPCFRKFSLLPAFYLPSKACLEQRLLNLIGVGKVEQSDEVAPPKPILLNWI